MRFAGLTVTLQRSHAVVFLVDMYVVSVLKNVQLTFTGMNLPKFAHYKRIASSARSHQKKNSIREDFT